MPTEVPSYLGTRGQGLDDTYDIAHAFFGGHKPQCRTTYRLILKPKTAAKFGRQKPNQDAIALITGPAGAVVRMKDCAIDPALVQEVIEFIKSRKKPDVMTDVETLKGSKHVGPQRRK